MVRVRCLSAVQDLVLQAPVLQQTQQLQGMVDGSLLQRFHNNLFSSLAGGCSLPAVAAAAGVQCSSDRSTLSPLQQHLPLPSPSQQQQQQQPQPQQLPNCWQQSRSYARAFRSGQRSDRGDARQDRYQQQQQQPRVELSQLRLGRHLGNCIATETIRQPNETNDVQEDPFKERDPLLINPRQVRQHCWKA